MSRPLLLLIIYTLGCGSNTKNPDIYDPSIAGEDVQQPEPVDTSESEPETHVEPDNGPEDPCADYDWIQVGKVHMCTYECGGAGPCTPVLESEKGKCVVACDDQFRELAQDLLRHDPGFIYPLEQCPATCTPVE